MEEENPREYVGDSILGVSILQESTNWSGLIRELIHKELEAYDIPPHRLASNHDMNAPIEAVMVSDVASKTDTIESNSSGQRKIPDIPDVDGTISDRLCTVEASLLELEGEAFLRSMALEARIAEGITEANRRNSGGPSQASNPAMMQATPVENQGKNREYEAQLELLMLQMGHMSAMISEQGSTLSSSMSQGIAHLEHLVRAESEGRSRLCEVPNPNPKTLTFTSTLTPCGPVRWLPITTIDWTYSPLKPVQTAQKDSPLLEK